MMVSHVRRTLLLVFVGILLYSTFSLYYWRPQWNVYYTITHVFRQEPVQNPRFLYLIQVASCLSDYYLTHEVLGNATACRCDVIVLCYKLVCPDVSKKHITYINGSSLTWTRGRNRLYEYATSKPEYSDHLYYIFMDADLIFQRTDTNLLDDEAREALNDTSLSLPPLRLFDRFLERVKPSVGTGLACTARGIFVKGYFLHDCCSTSNLSAISLPEYYPFVNYDEMFIAYHVHTLSHLFPLPTQYEDTSWWMSNIIMMLRLYVKFRGQNIRYTAIKIDNGGHSAYPNRNTDGYDVLLKVERGLAPTHLQNHPVWEDKLFVGRQEPHFFSLINPPFKMIPYRNNPSMEPYYGITHPEDGQTVKPMVLK